MPTKKSLMIIKIEKYEPPLTMPLSNDFELYLQ